MYRFRQKWTEMNKTVTGTNTKTINKILTCYKHKMTGIFKHNFSISQMPIHKKY